MIKTLFRTGVFFSLLALVTGNDIKIRVRFESALLRALINDERRKNGAD